MRFTETLLLLAALTSGSLAGRHGHNHGRHEGHARRQAQAADRTITVTTLSTIINCPCEASFSSLRAVPSPTPSSSEALTTSTSIWSSYIEWTSTLTIEWTTSTSTVAPTTSSIESTTSTIESTTSTIESTTSTITPSPTSSTSSSSAANADWTATPSSGEYRTTGFGGVTNSSGSGDTYIGNVGTPYGSNIISVDSSVASEYKYVVEFTGSNTDDWLVVIWNKIGPDGKMDGWYGKACHEFTIGAGETVYYAFDTDSQGGWTAAKGSIPMNDYGSYASTWGEFDFGSTINSGWSGFDVSAIQAQEAGLAVQGMKICSMLDEDTCSYITSDASEVSNAYTSVKADIGGIGGNLVAGPVRLAVTLDYCE
ncbi:Allergen [Penicillium cinerascens]|uniref:Allergen n=1 Tax=Penicillium cinerascens TaxID=70096 RepID=A0A9W9MCN5_9EURO|nr:Allergen [Penicillium cinerascens]KAJ5195412.1 Allergen [Penicillium cinerascens]